MTVARITHWVDDGAEYHKPLGNINILVGNNKEDDIILRLE